MNFHGSLWLALPLALLLPLGCNNAGDTGQASEGEVSAAAPATVAAVPVAAPRHHGRHHGGAARTLFHAARQLDLTDAQRATIDSLSAQLRGDRGAQQPMRAALADGVRAGNVDLTALAPLQAAAGQAHQARAERQATALNGLWAALEPTQRQALVASVRERQADRAARWSAKRAEGQAAGEWGQQRLAHLTTELGLDADQQQAVQGIMASRATLGRDAATQTRFSAMKARNEALLTAFAGESFDASKLSLAPASATGGRAQHAQFLAQLVPILHADQRETLADAMMARRQ